MRSFVVAPGFQFSADAAFAWTGTEPYFWTTNIQTKAPTTQDGWNKLLSGVGTEVFRFAAASVTVEFNANGGIVTAQDTGSVEYYANEGDEMPNTPAVSREGYEFAQWQDKDGKTVVIPQVFPAQNSTYYAFWNPKLYDVIFNSNGGSRVESQSVVYDGKIQKPQDPVRNNYVFAGWFRDELLTTPWNFDVDLVKGNTVLYAAWQESSDPVITMGWHEENGKWTYTNADGTLLKDTWAYLSEALKSDGWYCFDANGYLRVGGWIENASGIWSYVDESGRAYDNGWYLIGAFWYDFDENGVMQVGWIWDPSYNSWFYCDSAGHMIQGCWYLIGNTWYGFWANGTMCVGWIWDNSYGNWFYCDPYTGAMYQGCWAWIGNAWYGFWANGEMCYGWVWDNSYGGWFYCDWYSGYMYIGWNWIGANCYYFYTNGLMASNTYIDGYWVNASGVWR